MTLLHDAPPDLLIAEVQRQLTLGRFGYQGLYSSNQLAYRDMWCALAPTIHEASLKAFDHPQVKLIVEQFHELAGTSARVPFRVYALNTFLPGVDDPTAHQAEWQRVAAE